MSPKKPLLYLVKSHFLAISGATYIKIEEQIPKTQPEVGIEEQIPTHQAEMESGQNHPNADTAKLDALIEEFKNVFDKDMLPPMDTETIS